jgi:homoserine kinase
VTAPVPGGELTKLSWADGADRAAVVSVPATSANLGPGYDSLGLALARRDEVEARVGPAGLVIEVSGPGAEHAGTGEDHLVVRAMRAAFAVIGGQPPGLRIRCRNAVPQGYGLGSSAAAVIAGLLAARALAGHPGPLESADEVLRLAAELEGHPDNAAACLAGGLTICWTTAAGPRFTRLRPARGLSPVICLPATAVPTAAARQVLPPAVPHAAAAANSARAALLVAALTGDPSLLMDATEDFLHQRYRAAVMPGTASLLARLRAAGIPAVISGAGPAVLALTIAGQAPGQDAVAAQAEAEGGGWQVLPVPVDLRGATVTPARR